MVGEKTTMSHVLALLSGCTDELHVAVDAWVRASGFIQGF